MSKRDGVREHIQRTRKRHEVRLVHLMRNVLRLLNGLLSTANSSSFDARFWPKAVFEDEKADALRRAAHRVCCTTD